MTIISLSCGATRQPLICLELGSGTNVEASHLPLGVIWREVAMVCLPRVRNQLASSEKLAQQSKCPKGVFGKNPTILFHFGTVHSRISESF